MIDLFYRFIHFGVINLHVFKLTHGLFNFFIFHDFDNNVNFNQDSFSVYLEK